jgi:hypothetical protein
MIQCPSCKSHKIYKRGKTILASGERKNNFSCRDCGKRFSLSESETLGRFSPDVVYTDKKFVITSIQNNTKVNEEFLENLLHYCKKNDARLLVIPTLHQQNLYPFPLLDWDIDEKYIVRDRVSLNGMINVIANIKINASAENPLGGLDSLSKGKTLIVPHNQLQMRSLPVLKDDYPVLMTTTGTISTPSYVKSKAGEKAEFNHSNSAVFVEFVDNMFHLRILNSDETGSFYDVDGYYSNGSFSPIDGVEALITGDEHVLVASEDVMRATYKAKDSIVNVLKPKRIVRHDVLDCFTVSHHHRRDNFIQYSKFINNSNKIEDELQKTVNFITETTPEFAETYIISSNHHDHLKRWLTEADPKIEPWNAKIFHHLTYLMLDEIDKHINTLYVPDPFKLYCNSVNPNINFVGRNDSFKVVDIELSNHGDKGANGSRGSLTQFSKFSDKVVIGHSHTPGINKGAYSVGCSTPKTLEYVSGPSSWMNTHCVIYPNGKRQLINIINGKWK